MTEYERLGHIEKAGLKAGMSRNTAAKYLAGRKLPSDLKQPRHWRTRTNPFEDDWPRVVELLEELPELETKTIFEVLVDEHPERYQEGQLRTLQRHVKQWRAVHGPPKEVFFGQEHRPGEAMQTDFTWGNSLEVTIAGERFDHLLCHPVLPYSNWEWVTVCRSERVVAPKRGVQSALVRLGRAPEYHQTDNSTAATHRLGRREIRDRGFNGDYEAFVQHYGMTPRTIEVGKKNQNGDAESIHSVLKRRIRQRLLLRGSRDFESVAIYEAWLQEVAEGANTLRRTRLAEELAVMHPIPATRLLEFTVVKARVTSGSTVRVKGNVYSVPSRLIGESVEVRLHEDSVEVYFAGKVQLRAERLIGKGRCRIDYRHIIWSLVRKPGAFARYRYREELFPSLVFRRAYDHLAQSGNRSERKIDLEYLRLLQLAASSTEAEVESAIATVLQSDGELTADLVKQVVTPSRSSTPRVEVPTVDLSSYDVLLGGVAS